MSIDQEQPLEDAPILEGWNVDCKHIQSGGLVGKKEATASERAELCGLLGLASLDEFSCDYDFGLFAKKRYPLACRFRARFKQVSIYSLDAVVQSLDAEFKTELFERRDEEEGGQFYLQNTIDGIEDIDQDFFEDDVIALGRLVYEFFSLELDDFAQKEGEAERWGKENKERVESQRKKASPFAKLQDLSLDKKK